jgi:hypothetical protein
MDLLVEGGPSVSTELVANTVHETAGLSRRTAPHGRGYGLMMAIGSLLVLVTAALIVPGMALLRRRNADPLGGGQGRRYNPDDSSPGRLEKTP